MRILAIETSCDETAVCIMRADGDIGEAIFTVVGNALYSQVEVHKHHGGVFPALAKREHAQNLAPLLQAALSEAEMFTASPHELSEKHLRWIEKLLSREPLLARNLAALLAQIERPNIDVIAVTTGPGLEPALWVGVNAARVLALVWNIPLIPTNHLEGHIISSLVKKVDDSTYAVRDVAFPMLGVIISGGHTEFVFMRDWMTYENIGATRDDAVGEAYDKVGRMLGLPYPGGVHVAAHAEAGRARGLTPSFSFPRPMIDSGNFDMSFSGLKTAVMYALKAWKEEHGDITPSLVEEVSMEFEEAVRDVLITKTRDALAQTDARTLVVGGGVAGNARLREDFRALVANRFPHVALSFSDPVLATDNAVMIGMAGAMRVESALHPGEHEFEMVRADGRLALAQKTP